MIITKTPYRISFFGGGSDYPEWFNKFYGEVISSTINKYLYISCRELPHFFKHKYRIVYSAIENVNEIKKIKHNAVKQLLIYSKIKKGLEIHYDGDLPSRSGMGSSSSFVVGCMNVFLSLNKDLNEKTQARKNDKINTKNYKTISKEKQLDELIKKLNEKSIIAVDTETSSLNPQEADLVGISVCYEANEAFYIPVGLSLIHI